MAPLPSRPEPLMADATTTSTKSRATPSRPTRFASRPHTIPGDPAGGADRRILGSQSDLKAATHQTFQVEETQEDLADSSRLDTILAIRFGQERTVFEG